MHVRSLYLHNFRIYAGARFDFSEGINAIVGKNASGKTTVLEAIYFLLCGRSFRTNQIQDLIRKGESHFHLEMTFVKHGVLQQIKATCGVKDRKIAYNSTYYSNTNALLGIMQGVVMTPDDAELIKGAPDVRRRFLDMQLAQVDPLYVHHSGRYHRAMKHRNALLKQKQLSTIGMWEAEMANSAAYIVEQRAQAVASINVAGMAHYQDLCSSQEKMSLAYKTTTDLKARKEYFLNRFDKYRLREMELGYTLVGPHKDDLYIHIGDQEAKQFASEGQQRSAVAAVRLAEWQRLSEVSTEKPLLLIDDVGISLDESRKCKLMDSLPAKGQVFLSSTEEPKIKGAKIIFSAYN